MIESIFKAYDVRGKVGTELTPQVSFDIGRALGDWLPNSGAVAVGRDMRHDSAELAANIIDGLRQQGRDVIDIGLVSSDMMYFAVGHLGLAGGAMVTASHDGGEYNGIKFCREEAQAIGIDTGLALLRDIIHAGWYRSVEHGGGLIEKDVRQDWIEHVLSFVDTSKWPGYNIALDAGNGMVGAIAPLLHDRLPLNVEPMFYELDGTFPNHPANPMVPEGLTALQEKVKEKNLDFGIAFDGDGDRVAFVDETGAPISGGVMSAFLSAYFLQKYPGATIVYDVRNSRIVPTLIDKLGGKSHRVKVGHSYIKAAMREFDAVFGGEASGHYYFKDNWYADSGLLAAMIAIQVLAESGKKLSELAKEYQIYHSIPETNYNVEDKESVIAQIKQDFTDGEQDELDGLTVTYPYGWFNVRTSNTAQSLLRLNVEAETQEQLDKLVRRVKEYIK